MHAGPISSNLKTAKLPHHAPLLPHFTSLTTFERQQSLCTEYSDSGLFRTPRRLETGQGTGHGIPSQGMR